MFWVSHDNSIEHDIEYHVFGQPVQKHIVSKSQCNTIFCVDVSLPALQSIMVEMIARARSVVLCVYDMQKCNNKDAS